MVKFLRLPFEQFYPVFLAMLRGGLSLGPRLAERQWLESGTLGVWVPEGTDSIDPNKIRSDLFNRDPVEPVWFSMAQVEPSVFQLFDRHLGRLRNALLVVETIHPADHPRRPSLPWFSCDPIGKATARRICAFLAATPTPRPGYEKVFREASGYPTVVILTSLQDGVTIETGQHLSSDLMESMIDNVEHVLLGVFDEMSLMLWSRSSEAGGSETAPR